VTEYIIEQKTPEKIEPIYDIGQLNYKDIFAMSHYIHHNFVKKHMPKETSGIDMALKSIGLFRDIFDCLQKWDEDTIYRRWGSIAKEVSHTRAYRE